MEQRSLPHRSRIYSDDLAMSGVSAERKTGPVANLEHARARSNMQPPHGLVDALREYTREYVVVEPGEIGIDPTSVG